MALLEIRDISKHFGGLHVLDGLELDVEQGEILGLIGPNGAGKTTLFNLISGFLRPTGGSISFEGRDISGLQPHFIAKLGIVKTFQLTTLFHGLSVFDNVRIGLQLVSNIGFFGGILSTSSYRKKEEALRKEALDIMHFTGIAERKDQLAEELSSGWRRTLAIAVALAAHPKLILLDEPVTTLSPTRVKSIMNLVTEVRNNGVTVMLIEHNMRAIMDYCDRIAVLASGSLLAEGTPEYIRQHKSVIGAYLGS